MIIITNAEHTVYTSNADRRHAAGKERYCMWSRLSPTIQDGSVMYRESEIIVIIL